MGGMFEILDTASNSLKAEREVMAYAAQNVANMYTPGYKAKTPVLAARGRNQSFSEASTICVNHLIGFFCQIPACLIEPSSL